MRFRGKSRQSREIDKTTRRRSRESNKKGKRGHAHQPDQGGARGRHPMENGHGVFRQQLEGKYEGGKASSGDRGIKLRAGKENW